jgi:hypothetical protein
MTFPLEVLLEAWFQVWFIETGVECHLVDTAKQEAPRL